MGFIDIVLKAVIENRQQKSTDMTVGGDVTTSSQLANELLGRGATSVVNLSPLEAYRLYTKSNNLYTAVHRIAQAISGLELGFTTTGQDFIPESAALEILKIDTEGFTKRRLLYEVASSYLLTNEGYIVLRGNVNTKPLARTFINPFDTNMIFDSDDGIPTAIRTTSQRDSRTYNRVETNGRFRWIAQDGLNELIYLLGNESPFSTFRGQSPVASLIYDVNQGISGKRHNTSLLENGLRSSAILMPKPNEKMDEKAQNDVATGLKAQSGAGYAGTTLILGRALDSLSTRATSFSNQEMDYIELLENAQQAVYTYYGIPLPLISNDAATFSNYTTAQSSFFDQAVFPPFEDIADGVTQALRARDPSIEDGVITYNENTIPALAGRNIERMKALRAAQANSTDEIREVAGYLPLQDGAGTDVLVNAGLIPIGDPVSPEPEPPADED